MSKYILGIDPSLSSTGLAVITPDEVIATTSIKTKPYRKYGKTLDTSIRLKYIADQILTFSQRYTISLIGIESPSYGSRSSAVSELGGLFYIVLNRLTEVYDYEIILSIRPTTMKKHITGRGNATKEEVRNALCAQKYSYDESDAIGIATTAYKAVYSPHDPVLRKIFSE